MITLNQVRLKTREMILKDIDFTFEKGNIYMEWLRLMVLEKLHYFVQSVS